MTHGLYPSRTSVLKLDNSWISHDARRYTLSVFEFAQYYFSRGFKFARFKFVHPKHTYSRILKFTELLWIETIKIDKNRWIEAIFPQEKLTVIVLNDILLIDCCRCCSNCICSIISTLYVL